MRRRKSILTQSELSLMAASVYGQQKMMKIVLGLITSQP